MAISRLAIIKFLELAFTSICIGIHYHSFDCGIGSNIHRSMIVTGTFVGYMIILIGLSAGYVLQTPVHSRIDIFFSIVGCAMFVTSGALIIDTYQHAGKSDWRDKQLAKASMAIINGAFFLIDSVLRFRGE